MKITEILQVIVALGLLNVWLLRLGKVTSYRGGSAKNLKEEFEAYGLAPWVYFLVGSLKILSALALLAGIWVSSVVVPASGVVLLLMIGAIAMHFKINDPIKKSIPAIAMLVMSLAIILSRILV